MLTKEARIAAILEPYEVSRREVQTIIAVAELDAKLEFLVNGTPIATRLADSFARNASYRAARTLEDLCKAVT